MAEVNNALTPSQEERLVLDSSPGDILLSAESLPYPGAILQGFRKRRRNLDFAPEFEPYVDFGEIREFLSFLEHVVLCERLILVKPRLARKTERLVTGKNSSWDFSVYRLAGDLQFKTEQLVSRLESAGIMVEAELHVGEATADDFVSTHITSSQWLRDQYARFLKHAPITKQSDKTDYANAKLAYFIGVPLHTAEAAGMANVPFILGSREAKEVVGYERETLRIRRSVTQFLLHRLNKGARSEIERLKELGPAWVFPETPISQMIVSRSSTVEGLVEAAIELRKEFAEFRKLMNQIESDLIQDSQPLSKRLRRVRELEFLANSLWKENKTEFRTIATPVSEAFCAIPEVAATPSIRSIGELATKLLALPVEKLISIYRKRKIRLLNQAKKNFLKSADSTDKLAHILGVPVEVAQTSRGMNRPALTSNFIKNNPEIAAAYYGDDSSRQEPLSPLALEVLAAGKRTT